MQARRASFRPKQFGRLFPVGCFVLRLLSFAFSLLHNQTNRADLNFIFEIQDTVAGVQYSYEYSMPMRSSFEVRDVPEQVVQYTNNSFYYVLILNNFEARL
eukprot:SAG31_NODE_13014_length_899_cov_1.376250_2_plen_101_part_00